MLAPTNDQGFINFDTAPFKYEIVVDKLPKQKDGQQTMKPGGVTIHHSAVINAGNRSPMEILTQYANHHMAMNGGIAYHFGIMKFEDDKIYINRYFPQVQWHNGNEALNKQTIATLVDGNFQDETPTDLQLKKLRFHLDVLSTDSFSKNGWANTLNGINPRNPDQKISGQGRTVSNLHWHNEAAIPSAATACAGNTLKPYIEDYRNRRGDVDWGVWWSVPQPEPQPQPQPEPEKVTVLKSDWDKLNKDLSDRTNENSNLKIRAENSEKQAKDAKDAQKKAEADLVQQAKDFETQKVYLSNEYDKRLEAKDKEILDLNNKIKEISAIVITPEKPTSKFYDWMITQGRQLRYFLTNAFWGFLVVVIGILIQLGLPGSEASNYISQHYPQIITFVGLFFSNSAVQAYLKNKQEEAEKKQEVEKKLSE